MWSRLSDPGRTHGHRRVLVRVLVVLVIWSAGLAGPASTGVVGRGVALILHHALHTEVVLDVLVHVDVAEALGDVLRPLMRRMDAVVVSLWRCGLHVMTAGRGGLLLSQRPFKDRAGGGGGAGSRRVRGSAAHRTRATTAAAGGEKDRLAAVLVSGHRRMVGRGHQGLPWDWCWGLLPAVRVGGGVTARGVVRRHRGGGDGLKLVLGGVWRHDG